MALAHETTTTLCFLEFLAAFGHINEETPIHETEEGLDIHTSMVGMPDDTDSPYSNVPKYWQALTEQQQQELVAYFWRWRETDAPAWMRG